MSEPTPRPYHLDIGEREIFIRPEPDQFGNAPAVASVHLTLYPASGKANADFIIRACNSHDEMVAALECAEDALLDAADKAWEEGRTHYANILSAEARKAHDALPLAKKVP